MDNDTIKARARSFIAALNAGDKETIEEMLAPDYVQHSEGVPESRNAFMVYVFSLITAFPDGKFIIDDMIAEGDKVMLRWTYSGTNTGSWMGAPPTGRKVSFSGMDLWRYNEAGRLAEIWFVTDRLVLMQQLGAMRQWGPKMPQAKAA